MPIYYFIVERGVYGLLNAFKSSSVADAESNYRAAPLVADFNIVNAMWPPVLVRNVLLQLERLICTGICRTEGHARRSSFRQIVDVGHNGALPSSVGGIGSVYIAATNTYLTRREPDVVNRLRDANRMIAAAPTYAPDAYWAFDGGTFFCTLPDPVKVEIFFPQFPIIDAFSDYDGFFGIGTGFPALVPEEFELAWAVGAAGVLASKVGTFPEEAASYLAVFQSLMEQQGVKLKIPLDFNATE